MRRTLILAALALCGCELTEVALTTADDIIVAEVVLRVGEDVQYAYLHRTANPRGTARVVGASIEVTDEERDSVVLYAAAADTLCARGREAQLNSASIGSCYVTRVVRDFVRPGARYQLRIDAENRVMTGQVQVPGAFRLLRPAVDVRGCSLLPHQSLELVWARSPNAWVYVAEGLFFNLRQALRREGVAVTGTAPVELTALAVSGADTTLNFPAEFGVFDRFDADLHPIVLAIQSGLPAGVRADVFIGAGDRNYVNWVRGGIFNPSGQVRVPSVHGGGTGVFGALVLVPLSIASQAVPDPPACG